MDQVDFEQETRVLRDRFQDSGYNRKWLAKAYNRARDCECKSLILKHQEMDNKDIGITRLCLQYSQRVDGVRDICSSHWHLLREDTSVSKFVSHKPQLVYRRARSLSDLLVHSDISWKSSQYSTRAGMTRCGNCEFCTYSIWLKAIPYSCLQVEYWDADKRSPAVLRGWCMSLCVPVGRFITIRPVWKQLQEHIYEIDTYHLKAPLVRHVCLQHNRDPSYLQCWVLEVIPQDLRGGNFDQIVLQCETRWIWEL